MQKTMVLIMLQLKIITNLEDIKKMYIKPDEYRSCHTTVSSANDFIFEGHIPSEYITQFLSEEHLML
jgi:hypothetical protein